MELKPKYKKLDWVTFTNRKKKYIGQVIMVTTDNTGKYYYYVGHPSKSEDDWIVTTEDELKLLQDEIPKFIKI